MPLIMRRWASLLGLSMAVFVCGALAVGLTENVGSIIRATVGTAVAVCAVLAIWSIGRAEAIALGALLSVVTPHSALLADNS